MHEHDPRCEGLDDEKVLADVEEYGPLSKKRQR